MLIVQVPGVKEGVAVPNPRVMTGVDPVNEMTAGHPVGMTADLTAVMTADPVTDPEVVIIVDPVMVLEMKGPGKVELGNLAEVEVNSTLI